MRTPAASLLHLSSVNRPRSLAAAAERVSAAATVQPGTARWKYSCASSSDLLKWGGRPRPRTSSAPDPPVRLCGSAKRPRYTGPMEMNYGPVCRQHLEFMKWADDTMLAALQQVPHDKLTHDHRNS